MALATVALSLLLVVGTPVSPSVPTHVGLEPGSHVGSFEWWFSIYADIGSFLSEESLDEWRSAHPDLVYDFPEYVPPPRRTVSTSPRTTTATTATTAPSRGMGGNVEQWRGLVASHFPAEAVDRMLCLMKHESGGNPDAKNPRSSARGLFQILASLWAPYFGVSQDALYDPDLNVRLARAIWDQQGYGAWSPWNRGLCR